LLQRRHETNVKSRCCGTIKGTPIGGLSSAGKSSLHDDDLTVVTLNLSKNLKSRRLVAPCIATLSDDDPYCHVQKPSFASVSDDVEDGDICKEGMLDRKVRCLSIELRNRLFHFISSIYP